MRYIETRDKHYGGMTTDEYLGQPGCFYDGEGIEIRRNSKEVTLSSLASISNFSTARGHITCYRKNITNNGYQTFLYGTNRGYLGDATGTTNSGFQHNSYPITEIGIIDDTYGFYINSQGGLYRWNYVYNDGTGQNGILGQSEIACGFTTVVTEEATAQPGMMTPWFIEGNNIIYGCNNKIYVVDISSSSWALLKTITLDKDYVIRGMSRVDSQYIVYASNGQMDFNNSIYPTYNNANAKGKVFYYTSGNLLAGLSYDRAITWNDRPILGVGNRNNVDFVVSGSTDRRFFFINTGAYDPSILYQTKITTDHTNKFFFDPRFNQSIINVGTLMCIPAGDKLYTYGATTPGLPEAIVKECNFTGYTITSLYLNEGFESGRGAIDYPYILVGLINNASKEDAYYAKVYLYQDHFTNTGYLIENPLTGAGLFDKKRTCKYEVAFKLETATKIDVYVSYDDSAYTLDKTLDTTGFTVDAISRWIGILKADFQKVSFKMVLTNTNTGDPSKTPHYYSLRLAYDNIRDEMS